MTVNEIWRDISGYEGLYQVSNLGNVKSLNYRGTGRERPLKPRVDTDGYLQVELCKNGKKKFCLAHRLVTNAFISDKTNFKYVDEEDRLKYINNLDKLEINHKDEDHKNNNVDNLEWCTRKYNINYGTRNERVGMVTSKRNVIKKSKKVYQYDLEGNFIKEWESAHEIERQLGFNHGAICRCCRGKQKTSYGYIWRYAD